MFTYRDLLIERLTKEIHELRAELERVKAEVKIFMNLLTELNLRSALDFFKMIKTLGVNKVASKCTTQMKLCSSYKIDEYKID